MGINGVTYNAKWLPPPRFPKNLKGQVQNVPAERAIAIVADGMTSLAEGIAEECTAILNETASDVQGEAIDNAPDYLSALRQSIGVRVGEDGPISREVHAGGQAAPYAIYMEYGTSGGAPRIDDIIKWMEVKGIQPNDPDDTTKQAAFKIRKGIMARGVRAQPFLFPAFERHRQPFIDKLKALFK